MSERLIIRLASTAQQKQHWLIWSENEKEIIATGEVDNAEQLNTLTEKSASRQVICLLPGVDVTIREVAINGAFNRQMQQALPYLIEEDLAGDVEKLHFTVIEKHTDLIHVAICDKQHMHNWLAWLADANISCKQFIPEGLAMPLSEHNYWQAVQIGSEWIVRENKASAWSCESSMLDVILASKIDVEDQQTIESYSPIDESQSGNWVKKSPTLPMQLLTAGTINNKTNLLHSEFKVNKEVNQTLRKWRFPVIFTVLFFVLCFINLYIKNQKIETKIELVKEQVESVYSLAFPSQSKLRYTRIKRKITTMLDDSGSNTGAANFLIMLDDIAPSFKNNKQLVITTLKYDASRKEMRVLALGDNFQAFDKLKTDLPTEYNLQQGALNNSKNKVSGLLTIREE